MAPVIRPLEDRDHEAVVALSLRAWAPVFASLERVLAPSGVYARLHPAGWSTAQREAVEAVLGSSAMDVRVAEMEATVVGFVASTLHDDGITGEIHMIAVDPAHQRRGVATALMAVATAWMEEHGRTVALISTGGDPGHAPARRTYERAGFTGLPIVNYFRTL
jgi:ribosomal protein S18 acetylase RimI-like enzyme